MPPEVIPLARTGTRLPSLLAAALLLAGCATTLDDVKQGAQEALRNALAFHFKRQFMSGVELVTQGLAGEGGYLDNPLVRILLPPPVGLVIDVARDLHRDPRAALLETLMNRAAEQAVPIAGPILQAMLRDIGTTDSQGLLAAGQTAATDYLRVRAGAAVHDALRPVVAEKLAESGAVEVYEELLQDREIAALVAGAPERAVAAVAPSELDEYVTDKAVDGLFRVLAQRESLIRENIARIPVPVGASQ